MPLPPNHPVQVEPKRFLFVMARGDAYGGSARHVVDIAARLERDGHEVRVLVGGDASMEVPRRLAMGDVPFTCIPSLGREIRPLRDLGALLSLAREIRKFSPDIVSTHASKGGFLGRLACLGLGVPVIYSPHCWSFVEGFPNARLYRILERWMARVTTRIVAVCEDERQFGLSQSVGTREKTICIHNGLGDPPSDTEVAERSRDTGPVRIVMVGRFEDQKDQSMLLHALGELRDLEWRLTLVGEGPKRAACIEAARELGIADRVEFTGYSSTVEDHLAESDLFVLVSNWEGFPRSILEAMRAGLPVISSDVGGCRESVLDGITGRIVPRGDAEKLREALRELLGDEELRSRLGRRALEIYCEKFCFEPMYREHVRLYESLLGGTVIDHLEERNALEPAPVSSQPHHVSNH